jgi:hypothetical protein
MQQSLNEHPVTPTAYTDRELVEYASRLAHEDRLPKTWQLEVIKRLQNKINNGIY